MSDADSDYRLLFKRVPHPSWVFDDATRRFLAVNDAAVGRYGYSRDEFLAMTIDQIGPREDDQRLRDNATRAPTENACRGIWRHRTKPGEEFQVEVVGRAVEFGGRPARLVIATDVTGRQQIDERLREAHEQLRRVSARARARREEDRTRVARELHDQLGQALTGLKIDLHWLGECIVDDRASTEELTAKVAAMNRLLDDTIWRVRRISSELRPPMLDKLGLAAAIEWQTEEFARQTQIRARVRLRAPSLQLDRGRATSVFRMFQEALTNVASHAQATAVTVTLAAHGGRLTLTVSDNGVGMPAADAADGDSLGLVGMRERAALLDGEITLRPTRPRGTAVVLSIPLAERRRTPREDWT